MCCDNNCLFFIKVRTGSLIFGYIAAVLSAIGVLICVGLVFAFTTSIMVYSGSASNYYIVSLNVAEIFFMESVAGFTCTILLLYGITKNKPVLVKTYIIYGMIHLVLLVIAFIIIICVTTPILVIPALFVCVIYTLCIYMVYLTYKSMVTTYAGNSITNPQNLLHV